MTLTLPADLPDASEPEDDGSLGRGIRALNHPVRRLILRALAKGKRSASMIAREFELDLGVVSYHLNQVLARELEIVELVESVPRRGALEKFYAFKFHPSGADASEGFRGVSAEDCIVAAIAAMDAKASERLEGPVWDWFLASVDAVGWEEIREARAEFNQRVEAAVEKSRARGEEDSHEVVVGAATFPAGAMPFASSRLPPSR